MKTESENIKLLYIDLFCGAGGTSTGVESAMINDSKCAKVIACVNHDKNAIASHASNHPDALHFTEDIRTLNLDPLIHFTEKMKAKHPEALVVLWASLECTNFSKAKGGQSRDADSRTLAEHLFRYIEGLNPDYVQIENVAEFMSWGDIDANGKPISMDRGRLFLRWINNVKKYGYDFDHRILDSADFGAFTSRKRFFGQFAMGDLPIAWPEPTHSKTGSQGLFAPQKKWKAVKEVLELDDEGESIFNRKTPLVEATLERIYAGLIKFVAGGKDKFLSRYNSVKPNDTALSIEKPCGVITTENRFAIVSTQFLSKYFSGHPESKNISVNGPANAVTTKDHHSLVSAAFLSAYYGNGDNVTGIDQPSPTVTTKDRLALVGPQFLCSYHYNDKGKDINALCPTLVTRDKLALATPQFIDQQYGCSKPAAIDKPSGTLTANPKLNLVSCRQWILNPQFTSAGGDIEKPCFTLIAKMDKRPPYLVATEQGEAVILIYEDDSPCMKKIKEFMAIYGIIDIKMRMLKITELKQIMGFPKDYTLIGNQAEQKKYIGNAVEVNTAKALCSALARKLHEYESNKVAV